MSPLLYDIPTGTSLYTNGVGAFNLCGGHLYMNKKHRFSPNSAQAPVLPSISVQVIYPRVEPPNVQPRWRCWNTQVYKLFFVSSATGKHVQLILVVRTATAPRMSFRHLAGYALTWPRSDQQGEIAWSYVDTSFPGTHCRRNPDTFRSLDVEPYGCVHVLRGYHGTEIS